MRELGIPTVIDRSHLLIVWMRHLYIYILQYFNIQLLAYLMDTSPANDGGGALRTEGIAPCVPGRTRNPQ